MTNPGTFWRMLLPALVIGGVFAGGCEEMVDPVTGIDRPFTIYGFLNARADTQAMRVYTIEGSLFLTAPDPIDAEVTSIQLDTGNERRWQDSVVTYRPGRYGHVYWDVFRPPYEARYRLEVARSDGATSAVEVTVPPLATPEPLPPEVNSLGVFLPVLWRHAPRLNDIWVLYKTEAVFMGASTRAQFEFFYGTEQEETPEGMLVTLDLRADARRIFQQARGGHRLCEIILASLVSNVAWRSPTGVYDPEVLVEPGTFSNVENGFGFFGAGYADTLRWLPDPDVVERAGFLREPCLER